MALEGDVDEIDWQAIKYEVDSIAKGDHSW